MAKKLNITIQGRQVWTHCDCIRAGMNYWVWSGPPADPGSRLVDDGWNDSQDTAQQGLFATEIEAAIYAVKQADPVESPYNSWLVPYMVSDRFVFLNNDRMRLGGLNPGVSEPLYLANGPVGRWSHRLDPHGAWFTSDSIWYTEGTWEALNHVFSVNQGRCLPTFLESQLIPVGAPMTPETARQTLEKKLGPELVRLMGLDPLPPDIRGHILAKTHCWIPDEVTDLWAYLLEWEPPVVEVPVARQQTTPAERVVLAEYVLSASRTQTVYGRASFSATEYQSTEGQLTAEEIASIVAGSADRDEAERMLREHVMEWDYDCDSTEDYSYEDEEVVDYGGVDHDGDNISRVLERFFEDNPEHDPEREDDEE